MTESTGKALAVVIAGSRIGTVIEGDGGRLTFTYDDAWRASADATPLSLSMPVSQRRHDDWIVRAFLWGLLPDNEQVLERWARTYQVSAGNPFAHGAFAQQ